MARLSLSALATMLVMALVLLLCVSRPPSRA